MTNSIGRETHLRFSHVIREVKLGRPSFRSVEPFALTSIPLAVLLGVLRSMGDRLHEGLYLLDGQGRLQYANPAALRLLGVQRESQVCGREISACNLYSSSGA